MNELVEQLKLQIKTQSASIEDLVTELEKVSERLQHSLAREQKYKLLAEELMQKLENAQNARN